jgi:hypothetical protein
MLTVVCNKRKGRVQVNVVVVHQRRKNRSLLCADNMLAEGGREEGGRKGGREGGCLGGGREGGMCSCDAHAVEQKPFDEHPAERRQQKIMQKHLDEPTCSTVIVARRGADEDDHAEKQRDREVLQDLFAERSCSRKHSVPFGLGMQMCTQMLGLGMHAHTQLLVKVRDMCGESNDYC